MIAGLPPIPQTRLQGIKHSGTEVESISVVILSPITCAYVHSRLGFPNVPITDSVDFVKSVPPLGLHVEQPNVFRILVANSATGTENQKCRVCQS